MIGSLLLAWLVQQAAPVLVPLGHHPYTVSSASMHPGFVEGDVVVANRPRGVCGTTLVAPGDVVIVRRGTAPWIRRIVAGPGQTVQMINGVLYIDDVAVSRERADVTPPPARTPAFASTTTVWRETLPNGRAYLTLDFGPDQDLDNTPRMVVPEGHWFTLGDSRDNAIDSRVDGATSAADICGTVVEVVRSDDPSRVGTRP